MVSTEPFLAYHYYAEKKIFIRLDEGVRVLRSMDPKLDKLDGISKTLKEISRNSKNKSI